MAHGARTYAETRDCDHCGTPYRRRRDEAKKNRGLYCSITCSNADRFAPMTADGAVLKKMYCEQNMTLKEIGAALGVGWKRVHRAVSQAGIPMKSRARRRNPNRRSMATYRKMIQVQKGEIVHHLNCIETDDRPENLVAVSRPRHSQLHKQLERISAKLFMAGLISFEPQNGYRITPRLSELM
jgi:hypothetical protein